MSYNIAIDGPAGAGKSTVSRLVARRLGYIYVDTGAMYRAMALYLIRKGLKPEDTKAFAQACTEADISLDFKDGEQQVLLNGEDVGDLIRTPEVSIMSSACAAVPEVRAILVEQQKEIARTADVVMDGRDIGTNVLPKADLKIFLTASVKVRAKRRYDELTAKGEECSLFDIQKDIMARDFQDMTRKTDPLKQASDAVLVEASELPAEAVADKIISLCK